MRRFQIEQSASEFYTSHSGLALIGLAINRHTSLRKSLRNVPKRHGIPNIELVRAYVGLLALGKSDFEAIDNTRGDRFFRQSLGISQLPSASRLRQRFDEDARALIPWIDQASVEFLRSTHSPVTALESGHVALDIDGFVMDNSNTAKEGVSRTYAGHDGYVAMASYLGQEGWTIALELREGSWHGQREFGYVLERVLPRARAIVGPSRPLLLRLDSAHDARENRAALSQQAQVDFLIKWNPRQESAEQWLAQLQAGSLPVDGQVQWDSPRPGKRVAIFSQRVKECYGEEHYTVRRVVRLTERTVDKHGQALLLPDVTLEGWWTSLERERCDEEAIIALYRDHATSEQFHSEFKTDLALERLPSGKFDTNDLVLALGALTYNILRWVGLMGLTGRLSPVRHAAKRRRIRTVMQELMYLAARLVQSGRRLVLRFGSHCPGYEAFGEVYYRLAMG